ncbi:UNVERIFIED_CONTAM: hypothetical protein FKN15_016144 [Acipenser sinensis]
MIVFSWGSDCCRKLKNVLITIYWLGKAANSCASYSGVTLNLKEFEGLLSQMRKVLITIYWLGKAANSCASYSGVTLNLKEFEGLLSQMRKEAEDLESPKHSIRDSGYVDCWDSERSDSLSPPRHGRDDSFDSLDSFGSRSHHTPSPDVVILGTSDVAKKHFPCSAPLCYKQEAEDLESPKHSIRDSGYVDCWDSERSDSLSPPRHGRDDSFDSLDSFGSRSHHTPSPDVVILGTSDGRGSDSESDVPHRRMPDMRKDDMLARRTSYNEPRSAMPFNQYLPNKSNLTAYVPTPLRKKAAERQEYRKSWSTATSPIGGERPFSHPETIEEEYCETSVCYEDDGRARAEQEAGHRAVKSQVDNVQYQEIGRGHSQTERPKESLPHKWEGKDEEEVKRLQRLEKAAVRVLPTSVRYSRPDSEESQPAPPDIILRRDNDFLKCQQEGESDSEDKEQEQRLPDIEKDDLASRKARMNQFKPKVPHNTFLPMPCSQRDEEKWENIKKATHLVTRSSLYRQQGVTSEETSKICCQAYTDKCLPAIGAETAALDDIASRRARANKALGSKQCFLHFGPVTEMDQKCWEKLSIARADSESEPAGDGRNNEAEVNRCLVPAAAGATPAASCSIQHLEKVARYSHTASVSDDAESVSMIDMRCEDEAILQPHSKARHEHLHDLHNRLLEEDNKWQDDLVRWKNRRRSASQDLIKKEEERKKVERLMSGDHDLSKRRKSIKTYREIVEEKERRERELHEAYRNASSPEEAEAILRRYTQRFTVSEAVLERLEMPKFLERSVSVDSDTPSSPTKEASNPMKYLRQKSLPAPKFTATVQATISVEPQPQVSPPQTSPTRTVSTKAVPMLSPKPYSQPKSTQPALKSFKVDGMVRVNGETGEAFNGAEDERESASVKISLTKSQDLRRENLVTEKQDKKETETSQKDEEQVVQALETQSRSVESSAVTQQSDADSKNSPREGHLNMPESMNCQSTVVLNTVQTPAPPFTLPKRNDYWSWDPEEERKRQERWQQEQERLLQSSDEKREKALTNLALNAESLKKCSPACIVLKKAILSQLIIKQLTNQNITDGNG